VLRRFWEGVVGGTRRQVVWRCAIINKATDGSSVCCMPGPKQQGGGSVLVHAAAMLLEQALPLGRKHLMTPGVNDYLQHHNRTELKGEWRKLINYAGSPGWQ
jgi:hypothetical protein